jgi:hypothetical protein
VLVGCSDDRGDEPAPSMAAGGSEVSTGGATEVKVEGADLAGLDPASVTCVKQGGKINIGSTDRDRPLNRAVVDRVRGTLRHALDRDELPDIPLLCAEEVDRACAPWGLLAEDKQATLITGIEIAACLAPLAEAAVTRYELAGQIQARLRKAAYVLHARRYLADAVPIHPRQRQVIEHR